MIMGESKSTLLSEVSPWSWLPEKGEALCETFKHFGNTVLATYFYRPNGTPWAMCSVTHLPCLLTRNRYPIPGTQFRLG